MQLKAGWCTPLLHATDVRRSIRFYEMLGFELIDDDGGNPPGWARLHCQGGAIMFLGPEDPGEIAAPRKFHDRFLLTMYTPDLAAMRAQLIASGVEVSEIKRPPYMPSGEVYFHDPDGYHIQLCHWGRAEDDRWQQHLADRKREVSPS
jgi:catechol 2,3-dioxygenase-like lactoylglutathione lyase family enzyme